MVLRPSNPSATLVLLKRPATSEFSRLAVCPSSRCRNGFVGHPCLSLNSQRRLYSFRRQYDIKVDRGSSAKPVHEKNPLTRALLWLTAIGATSFLVLKVYDRFWRRSVFPSEVEKHLRKGIRASEIDGQYDDAVHEFHKAIEAANAVNMDIYSREYIGLVLRLAEMEEKFGNWQKSAQIHTALSILLTRFFINDMVDLKLLSPSNAIFKKLSKYEDTDFRWPFRAQNELDFTDLGVMEKGCMAEILRRLDTSYKSPPGGTKHQRVNRHRLYTSWLNINHHYGIILSTLGMYDAAASALSGVLAVERIINGPFFHHKILLDKVLSQRELATVYNDLAEALYMSGKSPIRAFKNWTMSLAILTKENDSILGYMPGPEEQLILCNMIRLCADLSLTYGVEIWKLEQMINTVSPLTGELITQDIVAAEKLKALRAAKGLGDLLFRSRKFYVLESSKEGRERDIACLIAVMDLGAIKERLGDLRGASEVYDWAADFAFNIIKTDKKMASNDQRYHKQSRVVKHEDKTPPQISAALQTSNDSDEARKKRESALMGIVERCRKKAFELQGP